MEMSVKLPSNAQRYRVLGSSGWALCVVAILALSVLLTPLPVRAQSDAPTRGQVLAAPRLNVRVRPSNSAAVIGKLPQGVTVEIVAVSDDGAWYRVSSPLLTSSGWVAAAFVNTGAAAATTPAATPASTPAAGAPQTDTPADTPAAASTASSDGAPTAVVVPARMNVRSGPGTGYPVVTSAANGARLPILARSPGGDWYQVQIEGRAEPAWVFASLTVVDGALANAPTLSAEQIPALPVVEQPVAAPAAAASSNPVAAPVAQPNTSAGFGYGITASMWQGDRQRVVDAVKQLGFGWVKQQIRWEFAEPERGAVNWQEMDTTVDAMSGNGINLMFSVVTSPGWARPTLGGTGGPPEDFQLFANFLGSIAGRYCGRLQAIEVWNEQNLRREWEGFPLEPASYMDLLKRSYNAIKGACPQMLVISGATTPAGYSDVAFDDIDYLRGMYQHGLKSYSDGIGIHPSGFANPPSVTFEDWQSGNYDSLSHVNHRSFYFLSTLRESRKVMEQYGDAAKKLWPTEFGWGSTPSPFPGYEYEARIDEATQARWIVEAFNIMAGSGYVAVPMLWNLNYPRDTEMGAFAVLGRPAFDALRQMTGR
jgi:uncharacterized protein YraI